eukprot:4630482-Amphidinium_carterae.1
MSPGMLVNAAPKCIEVPAWTLSDVQCSLGEVVRAAVRQNGQALQYADSSLREDVDVACSSVLPVIPLQNLPKLWENYWVLAHHVTELEWLLTCCSLEHKTRELRFSVLSPSVAERSIGRLRACRAIGALSAVH